MERSSGMAGDGDAKKLTSLVEKVLSQQVHAGATGETPETFTEIIATSIITEASIRGGGGQETAIQ